MPLSHELNARKKQPPSKPQPKKFNTKKGILKAKITTTNVDSLLRNRNSSAKQCRFAPNTSQAYISGTLKATKALQNMDLTEVATDKKYRQYQSQVDILNRMKEFLKINHHTMHGEVKKKFIV
jgi:hypothetical protein